MGKQIELNINDITELKEYNAKYCQDILNQIDSFKETTIGEFKLQQSQISMSREKLDNTFNQLVMLEKNFNETNEIVIRQREQLGKSMLDITHIQNDKLDVA